LSIFTCLNFIQ